MSSDDRATRHGTSRDDNSSSISKLEAKLEGMNLHNTEDVDQTTNYAPAVTKEIVKPVVHEKIEEHITRDIHEHDVYTKILPVRDVEVLPARHWVPGPDGKLIQVDEKDVYSGAAFNMGQTTTTTTTTASEVEQHQLRQSQASYGETSSAGQHIDRHTVVTEPKVLPGEVKQVVQQQVHQPEVVQYHVVGQEHVNSADAYQQGSVTSFEQYSTTDNLVNQREVTPGHTHSSGYSVDKREVTPEHTHRTPIYEAEMNQHQIPRKPVGEDPSTTGHVTFNEAPVSVNRYESNPGTSHHDQHRTGVLQAGQYHDPNTTSRLTSSQPAPSPYEFYEAEPSRMNQVHHSQEPQHRVVQDQMASHQLGQGHDHRSVQYATNQPMDSQHQSGHGLFHRHKEAEDSHARQNETYQERAIQQEDKYTAHHHHHDKETSTPAHHQKHADHDPVDAHHRQDEQYQTGTENRGEVSPGLLDPYRVKNGPVHHADDDAAAGSTDKPLPDLPEVAERKLAGHSILTTDDRKGHTKLHKEPKEGRHGGY